MIPFGRALHAQNRSHPHRAASLQLETLIDIAKSYWNDVYRR